MPTPIQVVKRPKWMTDEYIAALALPSRRPQIKLWVRGTKVLLSMGAEFEKVVQTRQQGWGVQEGPAG